jgi:hypothetical protein
MYTLRGRILCALASIVLAILLLRSGKPGGGLLFAVPPLLAWGYVRYGPIAAAFHAYHARDWRRLKRLLSEVRQPEWLRPQDRAYFEFMSGVLAQVRGDVDEARARLSAVDAAHLRNDHMRCVLECRRAEAAITAGDRMAAERHLAGARAIPHRAEANAEIERLGSLVRSA